MLVDAGRVAGYLRDEAMWADHGRPLAVVRARTTADVAATVAVCARHRAAIVPRGAGTGVSGGANAVDGGVVVCTELMRDVVEINVTEGLAVVQPGVVNDDLRAVAAQHGLWYPPDPGSASSSTIGGNVATNAGGLCCVKYGVTRDYVLALEGYDERGRRPARPPHRQGVAGYDLVGLLVGPEGTLGVITEVTVRLLPMAHAPRTVVGFFDTMPACGTAIARVAARGLRPAAFELIDRYCVRAVNEWKNAGLPEDAAALLLAQSDLPEPAAEAEAAAILAEFEAAGARDAVMSSDSAEGEALFAARRLVYPALERRGDDLLVEDICLPRARLHKR